MKSGFRLERTEFLGFPWITVYCGLKAPPSANLEDWANCQQAVKECGEYESSQLCARHFCGRLRIWHPNFPDKRFVVRDQQVFWNAIDEMAAVPPIPFVYGIDG